MDASFIITRDDFSYLRNALFAVEVLDPVTLTVVRDGVHLTAKGLARDPIISYSGRFVWLEERNGDEYAWPETVTVDPGNLPFERTEVDAPAKPPDVRKATEEQRFVRIVLRPKSSYAFRGGDGVLAVRGRLVEDATADPQVPVMGATMWLRWQDADTQAWNNAPVTASTTTAGEFLTFLRLTPAASPVVDAAGRMAVVIRVRRNEMRDTAPFFIPQGQMAQTLQTLDWSVLQPTVNE